MSPIGAVDEATLATSVDELELVEAWYEEDPSVRVRFALALDASTGAGSSSLVYLEVPPGQRTPWHTHTAEEVVYVIEGRAEAGIGDERVQLEQGGVALVPSNAPHGVWNVGEGTLRFLAFFSAAAMLHTFDQPLMPLASRVFVTPNPEEFPPVAAL
jgi:quercetin dioxygenase-like cupin family protein